MADRRQSRDGGEAIENRFCVLPRNTLESSNRLAESSKDNLEDNELLSFASIKTIDKSTKNMFRILLSRMSHKLPDQSMIFPVSRLSLESYDVENQKWCDDPKPAQTSSQSGNNGKVSGVDKVDISYSYS